MAFGSYFAGAVPGTSPLLLALAVVWFVSLIHLMGVDRASADARRLNGARSALSARAVTAAFATGTEP